MPKNKPYLTIYLNDEEREFIVGQAAQCGLPVSRFVKKVCLTQDVRSTVDQRAVLALLQSKGDLGRLGGVLKHHLSQTGGTEEWHGELRRLLREIEKVQLIVQRDFREVADLLLQGRRR